MKFLCALCVLCGLAVPCAALDREAFTFTNYRLSITIDPEQQRLEVRGDITLRNDSSAPQRNLSLQISSSLHWSSIQLGDQPVQFLSQPYTSDIDHTGQLSEAIVSLPQAVPPKGTVDLQIGYEGAIPLDTTRLNRIGVAEETARHTDWDQISDSFTVVRGVGYVTWYPVATESASLSEGDSVFETIDRWKLRNAGASMNASFQFPNGQVLLFSGLSSSSPTVGRTSTTLLSLAAFSIAHFGVNVPSFALGDYQKLGADRSLSSVFYLPGRDGQAKAYADAITRLSAAVSGAQNLQVVQLPDPDAASFTTEKMLLTPLKTVSPQDELALVYALARQCFRSGHAWIQDGFAHYEQASYIEHRDGREAALRFLSAHLDELVKTDKAPGTTYALADAPDNLYLQTKAMYVWWMLRDMARGETPLVAAERSYRPQAEEQANYLPQLIQQQFPARDLSWFFDDWVYHDRGLPDFHVASVFPSRTTQGTYIVTVTVQNSGAAGAEVPVTVRSADGDETQRLEVRGHSKSSVRVITTSYPQEVVVNDGSVPESGMSNNTFTVPPPPDAR